nr:uncharacterized protein LOC111509919 [Leptinotarsa decemlineata]
MLSFKISIVFFCLIALCYCDTSTERKKKYHHKHLFFHEFHYLLFLALKVKFFLVLGTIWAFSIFFGKVFAAIKLAEYMKKNYYHDDHHEKIVYAPSHHESFEYSGPYGKSYSSGSFPEFSIDHHPGSDFTQDFSPPDSYPAENYGASAPGDGYDPSRTGNTGRSDDGNGGGIFESLSTFSRIVRKLNTTDVIFRDMHLSSDECKRKFVCEAEFNVRQSYILKAAYDLLSDDSYQKYKQNETITTIDDCGKLNPTCHEDTTR